MKNIYKGWKTSVIGGAIVIAALASVFVKGASWSDAILAITLGVTLLFTPDTLINKLKSKDEKTS